MIGAAAAIVVEKVGPLVTVQDGGRIAVASSGMPRSGAWDRTVRARAIAAVGGAQDDAVIEVPLVGATFRARGAVVVSIDGAPARTLEDGERLVVERHARAVRAIAVAGGIDVPVVLGARATLVVARFGGFHGRSLQAGDVLTVGERRAIAPPRSFADDLPIGGPLEAIATHDADPSLVDHIASIEWTIDPRSDRVGTRLALRAAPTAAASETRAFPIVAPARGGVRPLVRGAVELPPNGHPIVIGPDGPTTGGYATIAILTREACDRLARARPGSAVRLRITSGDAIAHGIVAPG